MSLQLDLATLRSIVIVKPSSLGDIVHTLPLLSLLRQHAPQARIEWVVNTVWKPLLEDHPLLDGLIEFPRDRFKGVKELPGLLSWYQEQGARNPDLVLDVQGLLRSGLICRALHGGLTLGYSDSREGAHWFHQHRIPVGRKRSPHAVDRYLTLFQELEIPLPDAPEFPLPPGTPWEGERKLPCEPFILLHPFSRGTGKSLDHNQVKRLTQLWKDTPVVIVGRGDALEEDLGNHTVDLLNQTTLSELIWILRQARFVVSVDSGPMHLAAAVTPELLSIHTWSDPRKVGPYRKEAWVWKSGRIQQMRDYEAPEVDDPTISEPALGSMAQFVREKMR